MWTFVRLFLLTVCRLSASLLVEKNYQYNDEMKI